MDSAFGKTLELSADEVRRAMGAVALYLVHDPGSLVGQHRRDADENVLEVVLSRR